MVFAAFLPWHGEIQRVNELWRLTVYSTDDLFHFDFMTILAGLLYLPFLALAHKGRVWKTLGTIAAGLCLSVGGYTYLRFFRAGALVGLKVTLLASLLAIVMILLVKGERDSTPA